jgi:hypothetical protein
MTSDTSPRPISPLRARLIEDMTVRGFRMAAETLLTIAADPRHLGVRIGATAVLHSWGSALTQNPHS